MNNQNNQGQGGGNTIITGQMILAGAIGQRHLTVTPINDGALYFGHQGGFDTLAIGTSAQVLTVVNDKPSWATLSSIVKTFNSQAITANTNGQTGLTMQGGWGFVTGNGSNTMTKAITFPTAFTTLVVPPLLTGLGGKNSAGVPTSLSQFVTDYGVAQDWIVNSPTVNGFTAYNFLAATLNSNQYSGFSWLAIGII
jgi:hypothetical protein